MGELISIIVPVYNVENYIGICIESILNQTYKNIELILVDDGSIDGSGQICDVYLKQDSRIVVVHKKNEGVSVARNTGIQIAKGKYIQFVDSDDFLEKDMSDILLRELKNDNSMSVCNIKIYYKNKKHNHNLVNINKDATYSIQQYLCTFLTKYQTNPFIGSPCNKIFIKAIIINNDIKFQEGRTFAEDFIFNVQYLYHISNVIVINKPLYYYRMDTENSLTKAIKPVEYWWENYKQLYNIYKGIFKHYGILKENDIRIRTFVEFAVRHCIRICFRCKYRLTFKEKVEKLRYLCEDNLTKESMPIFECKDQYMKIVRFFSQRGLYDILTALLVLHSFLVDVYKNIMKF